MKVLHVEAGRHLYGGAQQVVYLLEGLARHGVENLLACPCGSAISAAAPAPTQVLELPMAGDHDLRMIFRLRRLIRTHRPDVVHLHSRRGADIFGALAALGTPAAVVLSRRVDNPESRFVIALKYRLYDRVITISRAIARVLDQGGVPAAKVQCVHSAVDPARWQQPRSRAALNEEFSLATGAPVIGMAAQFIPRKGHDVLLRALPMVVAEHPDVQVLLFGKGREQERVQHQAEAAGLAHNVVFAGFRNDLSDWLGAMDMLVHPACMEGLGVALLQGASAGLPIIASDAGGMNEIVIHEQTGLLVPPGDAASLGGAINKLLGAPDHGRALGAAARAYVAAEFSIDAMTRGNLAVYQDLVAT